MMAAPFLCSTDPALPGGLALVVVMAVISFGTAAMVHLVTLPVEFDASFNRALPLLKEYVPPGDIARRPPRTDRLRVHLCRRLAGQRHEPGTLAGDFCEGKLGYHGLFARITAR